MPKAHTEVVVEALPNCDFCKEQGKETQANYDGRTVFGAWANMCHIHFGMYGTGLGLGRGQKLLLQKRK